MNAALLCPTPHYQRHYMSAHDCCTRIPAAYSQWQHMALPHTSNSKAKAACVDDDGLLPLPAGLQTCCCCCCCCPFSLSHLSLKVPQVLVHLHQLHGLLSGRLGAAPVRHNVGGALGALQHKHSTRQHIRPYVPCAEVAIFVWTCTCCCS